MNHSRPKVGGASTGSEQFRENYDRIFGTPQGAVCEECGAKLKRHEFAYCAAHKQAPDA